MPSKGYLSSFRGTLTPSAYAEIMASDFGQLGGAAPVLAYNAGAGSLAMSTGRVAVSWITTEGETQVSTEQTVSVLAATGAITVTKPTTPPVSPQVNGATVLGWRVYSSSGGAGTPLLNAAALSTTQVQQNFSTATGVIAGFPLTTTSVQILIYGAGQAEPLVDRSGIQDALPSIASNVSATYFFRIPNSGSEWRVQKSVTRIRPQGLADPAGVSLGALDIVAPLYPGTSQSVTASQTTPIYFIMNGYLFKATASGTTASAFIGFSAFNTALFGTTTDGTVTWTCYGRAILVRAVFTNASGSTAIPTSQEYDLFAE